MGGFKTDYWVLPIARWVHGVSRRCRCRRAGHTRPPWARSRCCGAPLDLAGGLAGVVSLEHGLGVALQQLDGGLAVEPAGHLVEQLQVAEVRTGYFTAMR